MTFLAAAIALLLPWAAGALVVRAMTSRTPALPHHWGYALGLGYLFGFATCAALTYVALRAGAARPQLWVIGFLAAAALAAVWVGRRSTPSPSTRRPDSAEASGDRLFAVAIVALALGHWLLLAHEALARPVFPWDAWAAWSVKAKLWFFAEEYVPVLSVDEWLRSESLEPRTNDAAHYPALLPLIQLWMAWNVGAWNEPLSLLPWVAIPGALFCLVYGTCREVAARLPSLLIAYALTSLPLVQAQVALPGYADLWVAFAVCAAIAVLCRLRFAPDTAHLLSFFWVLAMLPLLKLEGAVWAALLAVTALFVSLPARRRVALIGGTAGLLILWYLVGGFSIPLGDDEALIVRPDLIQLPGADAYHITPANTAPAFGHLLLQSWSWNLYWYLLPVALLATLLVRRASPLAPMLTTFTLLTVAFIVGLFFLTDASAWAKDYTSANRLILHAALGLGLGTAVLYLRRAPS